MAFSIYRFDDRDKTALAWLIFCGAYLISGWMAGGTYFRYYPTVKAAVWNPMTVSFMCVYLALVLTPRDSRPKGGQAVEIFTIKGLNFAYPEQAKNAISDLSLSVQPGEFLVLCGPSGCSKSTLLRQLKTVLAPHGRRSEKFCLREEISILLTSANRQKKSASCSKAPKTRSSRIRSGMSWRSGWNPSAMTRRRFAAVLPKWQVSSASRRGFISPSLRFRAVKSSS